MDNAHFFPALALGFLTFYDYTTESTAAPIQKITNRDPLPVRWRHARQSTTSFSRATVARLRTWSWRHGSQDLVVKTRLAGSGREDTARRICEGSRSSSTRGRRRASSDRHVAIFVPLNIPNRQLVFLPLTPPPVEEVRLVTMTTDFVHRIT